MFCSRCGKQLNDEDRFCAHCGARVQELEQEVSYGEVVFNPPFRREAEAKTREIEEGLKNNNFEGFKEEAPAKAKHESVHFDWNLDGYPKASRRRSDDAEFNWGEVIEKRRTGEVIGLEKIHPKKEEPVEIAEEIIEEEVGLSEPEFEVEVEENEATFSIEDLEKELFGNEDDLYKIDDPEVTREYSTVKAAPEEKFYTYNAKNDAFQELLDREKARLDQMTNERSEQWKEITLSEEELTREPVKPLAFDDVFQEPEIGAPVEVVVPPLPSTIEVLEEVEVPNEEEVVPEETLEEVVETFEAEEPETVAETFEEVTEDDLDEEKEEEENFPFPEESHEEKTKLRFSDVFPRNGLTPDDDNYFGGYDPEFDEKEKVEELKEEVKEEVKEETLQPEENETVFNEKAEKDTPLEEDSIAAKLDNLYKEAEAEENDPRGKALKIIIIILAVLIVAEISLIAIKFIAPTSSLAIAVDGVLNKITSIFI